MDNHEFSALQITILVRTQPGGSEPAKTFFDSVNFQYQMQDALGNLVKNQLKDNDVDFEEVIISLDQPAQRATKVRSKSSLMRRLFGSK